MFKGSRNVQPDGHTSLISSVGGEANAYTTEDETVFWETLPAQYLPLALWLEADRMATLRVDEDTFTGEREVVKEERRMRVDNQPFGRLNEIIYDQAFTTHPYKHPTIGSMEDLEAASIEDVRDFYRTYYVPGQRHARARRRLRCGAGAAARVPVSGPRPEVRPPDADGTFRRSRRRRTRSGSRSSSPGRSRPSSSRTTSRSTGIPDSYPLHIAGKVLSDGDSSRIYKKLVYDDQLAVAAFGEANLIEDPNLFYAVAILQPGRAPAAAIDALIGEFDRLKTEPISGRELQRAKNQFARDYILMRESNQDKALQLSHAVVIHDDITTADGEFEIFQNISAADVQRVARTYFRPENRVVITILPPSR